MPRQDVLLNAALLVTAPTTGVEQVFRPAVKADKPLRL